MSEIHSIHNPRVKSLVRLRNRRERRLTGQTLVDGLREVTRALASGFPIREVFYCPAVLGGEGEGALRQVLQNRPEVEAVQVSEAVLAKISFGDRLEGVVAMAETPHKQLSEIVLRPSPLIVVMERVEKPGNLGALLRTLDAVGGDLLISADGETDLFNPNVIRASAATVFHLPVAEATTDETLAFLRAQGAAIFAARVDGSKPYTEADYRDRPVAFVLGNEAEGLTSRWSGEAIEAVHLPMLGIADSLNVSTTAAVLLYEALRQRTQNRG